MIEGTKTEVKQLQHVKVGRNMTESMAKEKGGLTFRRPQHLFDVGWSYRSLHQGLKVRFAPGFTRPCFRWTPFGVCEHWQGCGTSF